MIINYETIGRSDEQIQQQLKADPSKLNVDEVLYAATLVDETSAKKDIYKLATELYPNDARAYNNIATLEYAAGNIDAAKSYIEQAQKVSASLPEAAANLGLIALQKGDLQTAENYISKATGANGLAEVLGNLNLAKGK